MSSITQHIVIPKPAFTDLKAIVAKNTEVGLIKVRVKAEDNS